MYGLCNLFAAILAVTLKTGFAGASPKRLSLHWARPLIVSEKGSANVYIPEGTQGNTSITVTTFPQSLAYVIIDQSVKNMFTIYTKLGLLAVNKYEIDYDKGADSFYVVIMANTGIVTVTATVTLNVYITDLNDEPPIFSSSEYKEEKVPATKTGGGTIIGLTVSDADVNAAYSSVKLSIYGGNDDDLFTISNNGKIKVATGKSLRKFAGNKYTLLVNATDGVNADFTKVTIVIDESTSCHTISTTTVLITLLLALLF